MIAAAAVIHEGTVCSRLHNGRAWAYLRVLRDHAEVASELLDLLVCQLLSLALAVRILGIGLARGVSVWMQRGVAILLISIGVVIIVLIQIRVSGDLLFFEEELLVLRVVIARSVLP